MQRPGMLQLLGAVRIEFLVHASVHHLSDRRFQPMTPQVRRHLCRFRCGRGCGRLLDSKRHRVGLQSLAMEIEGDAFDGELTATFRCDGIDKHAPI